MMLDQPFGFMPSERRSSRSFYGFQLAVFLISYTGFFLYQRHEYADHQLKTSGSAALPVHTIEHTRFQTIGNVKNGIAFSTDEAPRNKPSIQLADSPESAAALEAARNENEKANQLAAQASAADPQERYAAIMKIVSVPVHVAIPVLQEALMDSNTRNRLMAISSLRKLAVRHAGQENDFDALLAPLISDSDAVVAQAARTAHEEISGVMHDPE